jgi:7,8-dihydropterin-6-yl-methyl-4-(beta-D-ribofuranosyl)aminobenzene 5'-phosphate synthase
MIRLTTLVENTASWAGFRSEHGFSVFVETDNGAFLFDTGATDCLIHNAKFLDIDLARVEKVVLSHGHYDHAGGLPYLLKYTKPVVYAHPEIFRERYAQIGTDLRYIGIEKRDSYEKKGVTFILRDEPVEIIKGVHTTGFEEMTTDFEEVDKNFVYKVGDAYEKDDVPDDMSLVLHTGKGLFVIFGCAHRGIINIIRQTEKQFGKKVFGFIGGTHLGPANDIQRERTMEALREMDMEIMGPSHCTGLLMTARLYCEFNNKVVFNNAGSVVELD